ncbi:MAG: hypothetical protein JSS81_15225 [Acidobacteria bacterium]|nr:hypothetical protein [Acidobacteriota bacterium]
MSYTIVLLDGKELRNLSLEQIRELFFKRQINQDSLVCSTDNPRWQMLRKAIDVNNWIPLAAAPVHQNPPPPAVNPFDAPAAPVYNPPPPVYPSNQLNPPPANPGPYYQNGYSQHNQSETYYQAETTQTSYNFQNNPAEFAPSKYQNPANPFQTPGNPVPHQSNPFQNGPAVYQTPASNFNQRVNDGIPSGERNGLRPAAVMLIVNAVINVLLMVLETVAANGPTAVNDKPANGVVRLGVSLVIDILLAIKLWKNDDAETARKWVLARTYLGFLVFGVIVPFTRIPTDGLIAGTVNFIAYFLLLVSVLLVLHGKRGPSPARVMAGVGTFALFFLFNFGVIALSGVALVAPNFSKFELAGKQMEKYKIEGTEYEDKTTGAKVVLPEGWSMIDLKNPLINSPQARMIAIDKQEKRLTMFEVVPVPANLDMKRADSAYILDQLADNVVAALREESRNAGGFGENSFREITRMNIFIGKHPARLLIFEKVDDGEKVRGHLIITFDELTFYVLHSWCPAAEYEQARNDFTFFEKNFTVPDNINSPFTQSAETRKNKTETKKNY